jgi:Sulfatase
MNIRMLLKGAGTGVLLTLLYVRESLGLSHLLVYFHRLPLASIFLAVLADLVVISLLASLAWACIDRMNPTSTLWPFLLAGVLLLECHSAVYLFTRGWSDFSHQVWWSLGGAFVVAAFMLRWWNRFWFAQATRVVAWSLVLCGFPILLVIPELVYMAASTSGPETVSFSHAVRMKSTSLSRICWIIFDELSYDQVYEHRAAGLKLPNFDRLQGQSTTFSDVQPAGDYTYLAIPSMFLGRRVLQLTSSPGGELKLITSDGQGWEPFDAGQTIFADARRLGWTSGIVGWANPYCRFMAGSVEDCYWLPEDDPIIPQTNMNPNRSVAFNAASMPLQWLHTLIPNGLSDGYEYNRNWVGGRKRHYDLAMESARDLIGKASIRFEFIHLPIPHPPVIYDRKTSSFSGIGSYLDNLALTDLALGELLDQLEQTPEWQQTTVIVCGDHSLRPWVWQHFHLWTKEDDAASKGAYDPRPMLAIHLPGQRRKHLITQEFPAIALANLLDAIMRGRIETPDDLASQIPMRHELTRSSSVHPR